IVIVAAGWFGGPRTDPQTPGLRIEPDGTAGESARRFGKRTRDGGRRSGNPAQSGRTCPGDRTGSRQLATCRARNTGHRSGAIGGPTPGRSGGLCRTGCGRGTGRGRQQSGGRHGIVDGSHGPAGGFRRGATGTTFAVLKHARSPVEVPDRVTRTR